MLNNVNPKIFYKKVLSIIPFLKNKNNKFIFLKAWNEWAEGNVIEHSLKYGNQFMKIIRKIKNNL